MNWWQNVKRDSLTQADVNTFAEQVKNELGLKQFWVYINPHTDDLTLSNIIVPKEKRNQGVGSEAVKRLTQFAQEHSRRVVLTPGIKDPQWGTTSHSRLIRFYKRHGFVQNKGRHKDFRISDSMIWNPSQIRSNDEGSTT